MIRSLALITLGGALVAALCIGASGATASGGWHMPTVGWSIGGDDGGPALRLTGHEPQATRDLPWTGSESLSFDVPATVTYVQGPTPRITLSGPDVLVAHVVLNGTTLKLDRSFSQVSTDHALHIAITGPALHDFQLNSALTLDIGKLATDTLHIQIDGAGKVSAAGTARQLKLQIDGAAEADLTGLALRDATIGIDGLGRVTAGPTGDASITIDGAGKVTLTRRPQHLSQQIDGAGSVSQPEGQTL